MKVKNVAMVDHTRCQESVWFLPAGTTAAAGAVVAATSPCAAPGSDSSIPIAASDAACELASSPAAGTMAAAVTGKGGRA